MKQQNLVLRAALASAFGFAAAQVGAATVDLTNASTAYRAAKELPNTMTQLAATGGTALGIIVPSVGVYSLANPAYVRVDLSNGATFKTAPALVCSGFTASTGTATNTGLVSATVAAGGANASFATFELTAAGASISGGAAVSGTTYITGNCAITGTIASTTGITGIGGFTNTAAARDVRASVSVSGSSFNISTVSGAYITFARAAGAGFAPSTNVVVASNGLNFTSAGYAANNTAIRASLGVVQFAAVNALLTANGVSASIVSGTSAFSAATAAAVTAADVIQSATVTVNGPALAAAYASNGLSGIFLSSGDSACTAGGKNFIAASYASNSVTFNAVTPAALAAGAFVCLDVQGNTTNQIAPGQITATISPNAVTGVTVDATYTDNKLAKVTSATAAGITKSAYFVNASTSTNKTSVVRLVNNSTVTGAITATAYSISNSTTADGAVLGTAGATIAASIGANQSLTLTSADLEKALGFTPAASTDKYRVVFTVTSVSSGAFKVLNYTKDVATGNLSLSQAQDD